MLVHRLLAEHEFDSDLGVEGKRCLSRRAGRLVAGEICRVDLPKRTPDLFDLLDLPKLGSKVGLQSAVSHDQLKNMPWSKTHTVLFHKLIFQNQSNTDQSYDGKVLPVISDN
jgi:hypothetical protein